MCYIENLKMVNCKLINTTLAFEYSTVDAQIVNTVDSVLNPSGGIIRADKIGKLILLAEIRREEVGGESRHVAAVFNQRERGHFRAIDH